MVVCVFIKSSLFGQCDRHIRERAGSGGSKASHKIREMFFRSINSHVVEFVFDAKK